MKGTRSEVTERLQDANKKLRAEVKQLRKRLTAAENEMLLLQEIWQEDVAAVKKQRRARIKPVEQPVCPQCGNPGFVIKQVGVWTLERCDHCEYFNRYQKDVKD